KEHERMLTDGFYAEVTLGYDAVIAEENGGRPFAIEALRPIQLSKSEVLEVLVKGRRGFTTEQWRDFLIRSIGLEPGELTDRAKLVVLLRMMPFVERNYNMVEFGPRGTGKSHVFQQVSPYSHLVPTNPSVAKMFVNNTSGQRGLVCHYDVVCIDEVSRLSFDQKDGISMFKTYMASGEFSRGKESIRAEGGIVMLGNFDVDVLQQQKIAHLLSPLPADLRDDTAFHDRIHAYVPGWDFPKLNPNTHLTNHFGLVSDFLSECWTKLRTSSRVAAMQGRVHLGGALSGRDIEAVNKTVSGMIKLLFPDPEMPITDQDMEAIVRMALEARRRVKEQQKRCLKSEFRNTHFSYTIGTEGVEQFVSTPELHSDEAIESDPLPPGQVWAISPGTTDAGPGLYRIEVAGGPGNGVRILNTPAPPGFKESVKVGEQNLYSLAKKLVGDRDPRTHEFSVQLRAMDNDKSGGGLGLPVLIALAGGLLERSTRGGLIVVGSLNLGGSLEMLPNAVALVEIAIEKQAAVLLMPVAARRQLNELPDELWTKINIEFYSEPADAFFKALAE
ncbi:MAG: BREX system Lon protease-like protein BrxL, partial [Verrucomicrobiota bacterium]